MNLISWDLFPLFIAVGSMIGGVFLLRKHTYVKILPWTMSFVFLVCIGGMIVSDKYGLWIFSLFDDGSNFLPKFTFWGMVCIVTLFFCTIFISAYILVCIEREFIRCRVKYIQIYFLVTMMPVGMFLLFWFHYRMKLYNFTLDILFLVLEFINMIIFFILRKRGWILLKRRSIYIKLGIYILLLCFLITKKESMALTWYFSYGLLRYLFYTVSEVKNNQVEKYGEILEPTKDKKWNVLFEYIPITGVVISCIIIVVIGCIF